MKIIAKRVYQKGNRHAVMDENDVWYSYYGSGNWGKDDDGKDLHGKLVQNEEYEIEFDTNNKGYNNISSIRRLTFKEKGEIEIPGQGEGGELRPTHVQTAKGELVPIEKVNKPVKHELVLPKPTVSELIVRPQVSVKDALAYWEEYNKLKVKLLQPNDYTYYVEHGNDKPKGFKTNKEADVYNEKMYKGKGGVIGRIKKSGWRKLANAFNLSVQKISEVIIPEPPRETQYAKVEVLVIAPNGRTMPGEGVCSVHERGFAKQDHDIPATAMTRAVNRGISDLIAAGEVSAEEIAAAHSGKKEVPRKKAEVVEGELVGEETHESKPVDVKKEFVKEYSKEIQPPVEEKKPPEFTTTTQCTKEQKKEIRDKIKATAKTYDLKVKELSKEIQVKFEFETLDQVTPEKADDIIKFLKEGE